MKYYLTKIMDSGKKVYYGGSRFIWTDNKETARKFKAKYLAEEVKKLYKEKTGNDSEVEKEEPQALTVIGAIKKFGLSSYDKTYKDVYGIRRNLVNLDKLATLEVRDVYINFKTKEAIFTVFGIENI